jgi:hypothetical protein
MTDPFQEHHLIRRNTKINFGNKYSSTGRQIQYSNKKYPTLFVAYEKHSLERKNEFDHISSRLSYVSTIGNKGFFNECKSGKFLTAIISRLWITNILTGTKHIGQTDR